MRILGIGIDALTKSVLASNGMPVEEETDQLDADDIAIWLQDEICDAVVADLDASGLGIYAARPVRERKIIAPFIGISQGSEGRTWSDHRAMFLENGGDDLLRSPLNPRELVASLRAVARRLQSGLSDVVTLRNKGAELVINLTTRSITINGVAPHLTNRERALACILAANKGRTLSKEALLDKLYVAGIDDMPELKIIDVFVCKLRRQFKNVSEQAAAFIVTSWGRGYGLFDDEAMIAQLLPANRAMRA